MKSAKANITRGSESAVTWIFAFFGMHGNHLRAHGNHPWSLLSTNSTLFLFHSQDGARPSYGIPSLDTALKSVISSDAYTCQGRVAENEKEEFHAPGPQRHGILCFLQFSKNGARGHKLVRHGAPEVRDPLDAVRDSGGRRQKPAGFHRGPRERAGHRRHHTDEESTALANRRIYRHLKSRGHATAFFDRYGQRGARAGTQPARLAKCTGAIRCDHRRKLLAGPSQ